MARRIGMTRTDGKLGNDGANTRILESACIDLPCEKGDAAPSQLRSIAYQSVTDARARWCDRILIPVLTCISLIASTNAVQSDAGITPAQLEVASECNPADGLEMVEMQPFIGEADRPLRYSVSSSRDGRVVLISGFSDGCFLVMRSHGESFRQIGEDEFGYRLQAETSFRPWRLAILRYENQLARCERSPRVFIERIGQWEGFPPSGGEVADEEPMSACSIALQQSSLFLAFAAGQRKLGIAVILDKVYSGVLE